MSVLGLMASTNPAVQWARLLTSLPSAGARAGGPRQEGTYSSGSEEGVMVVEEPCTLKSELGLVVPDLRLMTDAADGVGEPI